MPTYKTIQTLRTNMNRQKAMGGSSFLEREASSNAKSLARNKTYETFKAGREAAKSIAPQAERRTAGRLSDKAYESMRNAGSGTRAGGATKLPSLKADVDFLNRSKEAVRSYSSGVAKSASNTGNWANKAKNLGGALGSGLGAGMLSGLARGGLYGAGAYALGRTAYEGGKALRASVDAKREQAGSEAKYGTVERASKTRKSMASWPRPRNYDEFRRPTDVD